MRLALAAALAVVLASTAAAEDFSFSADSMSGAMTKGRERAVLVGNALVISDGMRIKADRIELYGDDFRYIECSGKVTVVDEDNGLRLFTEKLFYDRTDRLSRMTGPSVMEDRRNRVVIKGDFIENDDEREIAVIQINVRILKDDISCRAEFARYDRKAETLELSGSPTVRRGSDEYKATVIRVDLETQDIELEGAVSGSVLSATKPAPVPADAPAEPTAGGTATTGAGAAGTAGDDSTGPTTGAVSP